MPTREVVTAEGTMREHLDEAGTVYARELIAGQESPAKLAEFTAATAANAQRKARLEAALDKVRALRLKAARRVRDPANNPALTAMEHHEFVAAAGHLLLQDANEDA